MLWKHLGSSSAQVFGVDVWGENGKWVMPIFQVLSWIRNLYWEIQHTWNPKHQYHVVRTDLRPSYWDVDTVMEAALVKLLKRYVEDEMGGVEKVKEHYTDAADTVRGEKPFSGYEDWATEREIAGQAIVSAYKFFTVEKPEAQQRVADLTHDLFSKPVFEKVEGTDQMFRLVPRTYTEAQQMKHKELRDLEERMAVATDTYLAEIVKYRGHMWT